MKTALTIAGSDSGGGAGIQADLKTFSAHGVFGMSAITAVTAQNTMEVRSVQPIETAIISDQIAAIFEDIPVDAVKIGMLGSKEIVETVAASLKTFMPAIVILDPVMISKSGHHLLDEKAVSALKMELLPLATSCNPKCTGRRKYLLACRFERNKISTGHAFQYKKWVQKPFYLKEAMQQEIQMIFFMMGLTSTGSRESAFIQKTLMARAVPYHPPLHQTWQMDCHCKSRSNRPRPIFLKRYAIAFQSVKVMDLSIIFIHFQKKNGVT